MNIERYFSRIRSLLELRDESPSQISIRIAAELVACSSLILSELLSKEPLVSSPTRQTQSEPQSPQVKPLMDFDFGGIYMPSDEKKVAQELQQSHAKEKSNSPASTQAILEKYAAISTGVLSVLEKGGEIASLRDDLLVELFGHVTEYAKQRTSSLSKITGESPDAIARLEAEVEQMRLRESQEADLVKEKHRLEKRIEECELRIPELKAQVASIEEACKTLAEYEGEARSEVDRLLVRKAELESILHQQTHLRETTDSLEKMITESKPRQAEFKEATARLRELEIVASKLGNSELIGKIQQIWKELPADEFDSVASKMPFADGNPERPK